MFIVGTQYVQFIQTCVFYQQVSSPLILPNKSGVVCWCKQTWQVTQEQFNHWNAELTTIHVHMPQTAW